MPKIYDRAYFDKWYRDPAHAVHSPADVRRKIAVAVALAEYCLGRPIRNVLDVGCGEGQWRAPLRRLRPKLDYRGLDTSEYVLARYGRSRQIGPARFGDLASLRFERPFDLILCANLLHYIGAGEIRRGLSGLDELLAGVAFIEVYARGDDTVGDDEDYVARTPAWYRRSFARAGLTAVGPYTYAGSQARTQLLGLETL
jgi:SAM-dependent methyltransferase